MTLLFIGLLLFAGVHLIPALAPNLKVRWLDRMGENAYKGVFALLSLAGVALMVMGWRSTQPQMLYQPPQALHLPALALMALAFGLLVVSSRNSRLRQWVRHPQLTGVLLWGAAHLLLNGDSRSLVLFGGLALWALVEIVAVSRREGVWIKDAVPAPVSELITLVIAVVVIVLMVVLHPWIAGMPVR